MYLIDTNIISFLQRKNQVVIDNFLGVDPQNIQLSSIVWYELQYGVLNDHNSTRAKKIEEFYKKLKLSLKPVNFDIECAEICAKLQYKLKKQGKTNALVDTMIAAQAIANNLILVTNNTKHFENIDGLKIEDWTKTSEKL
jgi:tRNA(fMet)-specific endonuclease VapC